MKIETNVLPRKDGTVRVAAPSGLIVFENVDGQLVADVTNETDLAFLLALESFCPADEDDYIQAESLLQEESGLDDLPDDDGDENAAPVELPTAPKVRPGPKPKK